MSDSATTTSYTMPDICAVCGGSAPSETFSQKARCTNPPKNARGELCYETVTLPICAGCLKAYQRTSKGLQIVYSVTVVLGAVMGFYTLYLLGQLPNLVQLEPYTYGVAGLFAVTLIAFYSERLLERRYIKREKAGTLHFRQPAFARQFVNLNGANSQD